MPRIAICAPARPITPDDAAAVTALAASVPGIELLFHPQCFLQAGHFAGSDVQRLAAFLECAGDPALDAIWFARGGYGACRIAEAALAQLNGASRVKTYLGYSDNGALLGGLYARGYENVAHGPIPVDMTRAGGEGAVKRALSWLVDRSPESLELGVMFDAKNAAFNITVFQSMLGTSLEPDLSGHTLLLEDVGEYLYRLDRALFQITSSANVRSVKGIKLGRVSDVPENDKPFGASEEEIARYWCAKAGIAYLGRADIGHDVENKVVPFGVLRR